MLLTAILFFACAVILGLILLSYVLKNKKTPKGVAFTHGFFAALGIICLMIYPFFYTPSPISSLVIFLIAASGGFVLIYRDLMGKQIPKWMAVGHGSIAIIGFIALILFLIQTS